MPATESMVSLLEIDFEDVPSEAIDHAKTSIRDVVGVSIYGSHHDIGQKMTDYVRGTNPGDEATLLGRGTVSAPGAALANGTFAHAIDYDDTFESIVLHPSAPAFPAALAAAELVDASGSDLLTGYVVGVEAQYRLGHSFYPGHYDHGWHLTGTAGSFGAVSAASSVLDLPPVQFRHALGIVASGSSSLKKNFGSMTKPLHAGHAAQTGLRAALLAKHGFTADTKILDGKMGYGMVMSPDGGYDPDIIANGLDDWGILDNGFKPYPSGVISHAAMEAMRRVVVENDLYPDDVEQISVTLDEAASEMLLHARPENELQAKFSIEFCLAAVLREREPGVLEFTDEYVTAEATRREIEKVERDFEEDLFGGEFAGYGARVVVKTRNGTSYTEEEQRAPGSPTNPLPEERWIDKFDDCVRPVLDNDGRTAVRKAIDSLDSSGSIESLVTAAQTN